MQIHLDVNGKSVSVESGAHRTLLSVLRDDLGLTGSKEGCGIGDCGGCTVLADGRPVNACLILAASAQEMEILTIEGLAADKGPTPVQAAFVEQDAVQCGFCTPGMIMAAHALLESNPHPDDEAIRRGLSGNLCRCTGYHRIFAAVRAAAEGGGSK